MPIPFTPVPLSEPTVIRTPQRVTIRQMEIAMLWWNSLPSKAQEMYRLEHPEAFKAADRITLFFVRNFPKCLAAEERNREHEDERKAAETHPTEPSADEIWNSSNGQGD